MSGIEKFLATDEVVIMQVVPPILLVILGLFVYFWRNTRQNKQVPVVVNKIQPI